MSEGVVRFERIGAIGVVTLDRPEVHNSFNTMMASELIALAGDIAGDRSVRAVVVTGSGGKAFCAGADIAEFGSLESPDAFHGFITHLSAAVEAIAALPQPVIAAVQGVAFGGGCELAMGCDLRIASEGTRFGLPEIKLGLLPGLGGTQRALRLLPRAVAVRMLMAGEPLDATTAFAVGFCERPTEAGGALAAAMQLATKLSRGPSGALAEVKRLLTAGAELELAEAISLEQEVGRRLFGTADAAEGVQAFLQKRAANFTGH